VTDRALVASDYTATSPVFTDGNEEAAACDAPPTVTITSRVTGEVVDTDTGTEVEDTPGVYTVTLAAALATASLDILDLVWEGTADGRVQTLSQTVEVVGGFYDSIPSLRTIPALGSKPAAQLRKFRTEFEDICETARGTAYVQRVAVETFRSGPVRLTHRHPGDILAVTVDGVAGDPDDYDVDPVTRTVTRGDYCLSFSDTVTIAYVHGYTAPPTGLVEACREYVRAKVTIDSSDANRNPSSVTNLATQEIYRFGTADPKYGRWTGLESVDSRINQVDDERVLIR
jgi:hypothetical protein